MTEKRPLASVVITTKNEEKNIVRLLESIRSQSYKNVEVIVVDNNSSDDTKRVAKKYTKSVFNFGPERSAQRNYGAKKAKGEYLLFLDADMKLSESVVEAGLNMFKSDSKLGALTIKEESVAKTFWEKVKAFERSFYNLSGDEITDAARFFKRSVFEKIGGYDEAITGPEDWDITENVKTIGYKVGHEETLIYHYEKVPNPFKVAQKKYYYGLRSYRFVEKHNVAKFSPKMIYFLRPVFYKNWRRFFKNPMLTLGMVVMLSIELIGGGAGYLVGKLRKY